MSAATKATRHFIGIMAGVGLASFLGCIDFTIVNTALPALSATWHVPLQSLAWIMTAFILALTGFMVLMGRLADRFGQRRLLLIGILLFLAGSLGAGLSPSLGFLITFRVVQGMACAILYPVTSAVVEASFGANLRGRAVGMLFAINGIGLAAGPLLGGIFVSFWGWRSIFLVNIPLGLLSLLLCLKFVKRDTPKPPNQTPSINLLSPLLLFVGLSTMILGLNQMPSSVGTELIAWLALACSGSILLILFARFDQRAPFPLLTWRIFSNPQARIGLIATAVVAVFYSANFLVLPLVLSQYFNQSDLAIGLELLPITLTLAIASPLVGHICDQRGAIFVLPWGIAALIVSALIQGCAAFTASLLMLGLAGIFFGLGWACLMGPATVLILEAARKAEKTAYVSTGWTIHNTGAALGLLIAGLMSSLANGHGALARTIQVLLHHSTTRHGALMALILTTIMLLIGLVIAAAMMRRFRMAPTKR